MVIKSHNKGGFVAYCKISKESARNFALKQVLEFV